VDLLQFLQLLEVNLLPQEFYPSNPSVITINLNVDLSRKTDVTSAIISYKEPATDGPPKEVTRIIDQPSSTSMKPKLPLGSGRCLIVNNPDLWSDEKDRQFPIGDWVSLVAAKEDEEITIVSLERRSQPRSFRVVVSKSGGIRAAIWRNAQYRDYSSSRRWHALGTSEWRFTRLGPDHMVKFNEEDTPGNPRTVLIFDPRIVEEVWQITRHPDRLPDEHYIVVKAR
jgi:hypothetical protein